MKKMILALVLTLSAFAGMVSAESFWKYNVANGSVVIPNRQMVVTSSNPGNIGGRVEMYSAMCNLAIGDPVILTAGVYVTSTAKNYAFGVTKTATLGSRGVIGVVAFPLSTQTAALAGDTVAIQVEGVALVRVGGSVSVTAGGGLVHSASSGLLTPSAGLTESGAQTNLSDTAFVAYVIETKGLAGIGDTSTKACVRARLKPR